LSTEILPIEQAHKNTDIINFFFHDFFGISSLTCPVLLIEKQNPDQPKSPKENTLTFFICLFHSPVKLVFTK